jgi:hypothetical protein
MRRLWFVSLLGLATAPACLDLGGVDEETAGPTTGGGGTGGNIGDSSFPDAPGNGGVAGSDGASGGSAGIASGGTAGDATGGGPSWTLWTYKLTDGTWSNMPVSSVWSGPNAPPPAGIVAVTQLEHFDRLLVFGQDGNYYVRADGAWQTPVPISTKFPILAPLTIGSVFHVSSPPGFALDEEVTFVANPTAVVYAYHSNDSVVFVDQVTMTDHPSPAPPQGSGTSVFDFELRDPTKHGQADYYLFYTYYSDGNFYQFDAAFDWAKWEVLKSPFWNGKPNAPVPGSIRAAWFDEKYARAQFIGLQDP